MSPTSESRSRAFAPFLLAFGLALALRLLRLGEIPFSDAEARWALQALDLTRGLRPAIGPLPGYVSLTALAFFVLQASNFAARLVPALLGATLVFTPYYFRDWLGAKPALLLAFFLALDPGGLALSRQADSPLLAVVALLFAWGLWRAENFRAAGMWAGLALLGGPQFWPGLFGLALTYGLLGQFVGFETPFAFDRRRWLTFGLFAAGTYLLVGSLFFLAPGTLGAGLAALPAYLGNWIEFSNVPAWRLLLALLTYELFPVLLALAGLVRGILNREPLIIALGTWLGVSLILALVYPSRQVADLVWVLLPILALAALEVTRYLTPVIDGAWETIGMSVFTLAILVFTALNFGSIALAPANSTTVAQDWGFIQLTALQLHWLILLLSVFLLVLSVFMVAFGWSIPVAVQGSLWGTLVVLFVYHFSTAMAAGGLRTYRTVELWPEGPSTNQAATLVSQMNDLSRWKTGNRAALKVTILGLDSPALRWVLRDWQVTLASSFSAGDPPEMVIASDQFSQPEFETLYRGQDLLWRSYPFWDQGLTSDWLTWSLMHQFPLGKEKILFWVRNDIFIDAQNNQ